MLVEGAPDHSPGALRLRSRATSASTR